MGSTSIAATSGRGNLVHCLTALAVKKPNPPTVKTFLGVGGVVLFIETRSNYDLHFLATVLTNNRGWQFVANTT